MWLNPLDFGNSPTSSGLWHQIIGKGQSVGGVENDNYQLVAVSNQLILNGPIQTGNISIFRPMAPPSQKGPGSMSRSQ